VTFAQRASAVAMLMAVRVLSNCCGEKGPIASPVDCGELCPGRDELFPVPAQPLCRPLLVTYFSGNGGVGPPVKNRNFSSIGDVSAGQDEKLAPPAEDCQICHT
jgi:hypothetical protein